MRPPPAPRLHGQCSRADLLLALARGAREGDAAAALLGFEPAPPGPAPRPRDPAAADEAQSGRIEGPLSLPEIDSAPLAPSLFWQPRVFESRAPATPVLAQPLPAEPVSRRPIAERPPEVLPLAPWRELRTRLQPHLSRAREGEAVDTERLVRWLSRGRQVERIPRRRQRRPFPLLVVLADRGERLAPYWTDQERLLARLARDRAPGTLRILPIHEARDGPGWPGAAHGGPLPPPGSRLLVLGDLGCLGGADRARERRWLAYARALRQAGVAPLALLPCAPERCPAPLRAAWCALPWERPRPAHAHAAPDLAGDPLQQLLTLLSPAIRLEPGLVRAVRQLLPAGRRDPGLESDLWQDAAIASANSEAASWEPERVRRLRVRFDDARAVPEPLRERVLMLHRTWRDHLPREIWYEELLSLAPETQALPCVREDAQMAERFFLDLSERVRAGRAGDLGAGAPGWFRRCRRRLSDGAYAGPAGEALHRLAAFWDPLDAERLRKPGYDPLYASDSKSAVCTLDLSQVGDRLLVREAGAPAPPGTGSASPLATLRGGNRELTILGVADEAARFWADGKAPAWADAGAWGWDEYGAWVEFSILGKHGTRVVQRLRWIAPGTFLMGSPEDEPGRYADEGPRHPVTIAAGYWMFDTPCTQALWESVMGQNPSRFKSPDRPVEQVSWKDAQAFLTRINGLLPGLELALPSEAQWEHACRARTQTALYSGPIEIRGDANAPALDPVAWYGGNSSQGFELDNGLDRSWLNDMQYPEGKAGTHPVAKKQPNAWGLYDMLGNVWEWVADAWHASYEGAPSDGSVWESAEPGVGRVVRGGSWYGDARYCRCAYRYQIEPGSRFNSLGFRCARVQVREPGRPGRPQAEPASLTQPGPRSGWGRAASGSAGEAGQATTPFGLRLDGATAAVRLPEAAAIEIRTDRERLTLHRIPRPGWASAMGRDRYGLWAEIAVTPAAARPTARRRRGRQRKSATPDQAGATVEPVVQRLRWIPPGPFLMGSPPDEPGRWDDEGPWHPVTIAQGFWLFDTPCTQALWDAVMDENPSRFKSADRPVERVSWADAQAFIARLNGRMDGLGLTLPSEAQWEHACRAGTATALYSGPIEILGQNNAPALDAIAWYGGNSGIDYDLDEAHATTGDLWKEMQYETKRAGTRPVKGKLPNPWGLYDMLGNVWEWCADGLREYGADPVVDPLGPTEAGAGRVVRGGSWLDDARYCRCAYRGQFEPGDRDDYLGFRCARAQEG